MQVMEAIESRRSIRNYLQKPVEAEKLHKVLEAGRKAPSARNRQEWKLIAVTAQELLARMPEACCGQKMVGQAPAVLVVCSTKGGLMNCAGKLHGGLLHRYEFYDAGGGRTGFGYLLAGRF